MKSQNGFKVLILLVSSGGVALGLFAAQSEKGTSKDSVIQSDLSKSKPNKVVPETVHLNAQMLTGLKTAISRYMAKGEHPSLEENKNSTLEPSQIYQQYGLTVNSNNLPLLKKVYRPNPSSKESRKILLKIRKQSERLLTSQGVTAYANPFSQIREHYDVGVFKKVLPDGTFLPPVLTPNLTNSQITAPIPALKRLYSVEVQLNKGESLEQFLDFCSTIPEIEYAERDYPLSSHVFPDDPGFSLQWHLHNIGQDYPASGSYNPPPGVEDEDVDSVEAWDIITDCSSVVIAVIDTGVDYEHPDLKDNMWINIPELNGSPDVDDDNNGYIDDIYGYNFLDQSGDPKDDNGHGTHCAGIIAAQGNNATDISGVCWSARIMGLKFLDAGGSGSTSDAIQAVVYAVQNGAKIISNSYGGSGRSQAFQEAIQFAFDNGVVFAASAGNDGTETPMYPSAYEQSISVAATNSLGSKASFSNYGSWVDLAAPGVDILSLRASGTSLGTVYDDTTTIASGTSMSCPVVAGICGLISGANPTLTSREIELLLYHNLDPISGEIFTKHNGRINAHRALGSLYGQIKFAQSRYSCSSAVDLWLCDIDLAGRGEASVNLITESGDTEQVILYEESSVLGFFNGSIRSESGPVAGNDAVLQFSHDELITANYFDQSDVNGQPVNISEQALADCQGPALSSIEVFAPGSVVTVHLSTDELSKVYLSYGLSCNGSWQEAINSEQLSTEHTFKVRNILPDSTYYFVLESEDALGNRSVLDDQGECFSFTTSTILGDIYVPTDFNSIQSGIDRAWDGDTVWLEDGRFTGQGNYNIIFDGKQVTVKSLNGPDACILDCDSMGRGFVLNNDPNVTIEGISVKKGYTKTNVNSHIPEYFEGGAGVYAFHSNLIIKNCVFEDTYSRGYGGAVYVDGSELKIQDCVFTQNEAAVGGACSFEGYYFKSNVLIENCLFSQNQSSIYGGAVDFWNSNVKILNSEIRNNEVVNDSFPTTGGGVNVGVNSTLNIEGSIIQNNIAKYGGGISVLGMRPKDTVIKAINCKINQNQGVYGGGVFLFECQGNLVNSVIQSNAAEQGGGILHSNKVISNYENCTISANISKELGGGIAHLYEPNSVLINTILWGNLPAEEQIYIEKDLDYPGNIQVSYCNIEMGQLGVFDPSSSIYWQEGNISTDPSFAFLKDPHLLPNSPCIDQGTNLVQKMQETDLEGVERKIDGNNDGSSVIDIGAYEFDPSEARIAVSDSYFKLKGFEFSPNGPSASIQIRNAGGGDLFWNIETQQDWIHVSPSKGTVNSEIAEIQIAIDTSVLSGGGYKEEILIHAPDSVNQLQKIMLDLHVSGTVHVPQEYPTIQDGIDAARDGDIVLVDDGVYRGLGNRDIEFNGKAIHLKSISGPDHCIIDAEGSSWDPHRAFAFYLTEETGNSIIEGFTLKGGYANFDIFKLWPPFDGGAIWCGSSSPSIRNCIMNKNTTESAGGAAYIKEFSSFPNYHMIIENCILTNNFAKGWGGALCIIDSVDILNSVISQNQSGVEGGGVWTVQLPNQKITNCTIVDNHCQQTGGGVFVWNAYRSTGSSPTPEYFEINNSVIYGNTASIGNEFSTGYTEFFPLWAVQGRPSKAKIQFSCISNQTNDIMIYPDSQITWEGRIVHSDPLFIERSQNNYRLQQDSLLIDNGRNPLIQLNSQLDAEGNLRVIDGDYDGLPQVDMGAYEFVPEMFQGPLIEISDWEFNFIAFEDEQDPLPQKFQLRNSGAGTVQWKITGDCPWLGVSPQEGESTGEFTEVVLQPKVTGLSRGLYSCQLAVEALGAANHPRTFILNLRVLERGKLFVPSEFSTIQQAIDVALEADQIFLSPGIYPENIYFGGKNITLRSTDPNDWKTVKNTIISGIHDFSVVMFSGSESKARLAGLTITGGFSLDSGGGIHGNGSQSDIDKCIIRNNRALESGGGIYGIQGQILNCVIRDNTSEFGGGIADSNDVFNSLIVSNTSSEGGGFYNETGDIIHCTIADNIADKGAGLSQCSGLIKNSIIWDNLTDQLYRSSQPTYSCIEGGALGNGNIDTDPEFVNPGLGNYRLAPGSLCIDAADTDSSLIIDTDIAGHVRPFDGDNDGSSISDIGAYEMPLSDLPVIGITQNRFNFTSSGPTEQSFRIWNASLPMVHYTISEPNCSWLSVSPMAGTVLNVPQDITLTVDVEQVPAGVYTCQLLITDPAAINSPKTIDVQLIIFQDEIHISPSGPTIQHALTYVSEGGTLLLKDGIYSGLGNRDIDFLGKSATVKSENGPDHCIIDLEADPNQPHRAFLFQNNESSASIIEGVTIMNGYANGGGGAVFCDRAGPSINNCVFRNNHTPDDWGGAVYSQYGSPIILKSIFQANSAQHGGAVASLEGDLNMTESVFKANSARIGGAIYNHFGWIAIESCILTQNTAEDGGAVFNDNLKGSFENCLFVGNSTVYGNWNHGGGAIFNVQSDIKIEDCKFIENQSAWDGGAIENFRSSPVVERCLFEGNYARGNDGGAIFNILDSDPNIANCTFTSNYAKSWGGAMRNQESSPRIENCLFVANNAVDNGGGIFNFLRSDASVINCTFSQNTANGHEGGAIYSFRECSPNIVNSIFWDNETSQIFDSDAETAISYSAINWPGVGNTLLPPAFVDPNSDDFRLSSTSPCIDAGTVIQLNRDIDGNIRPWDCPWAANRSGYAFDMGAYEFTAVPVSLKITPKAINTKSKGRLPRAQVVFPPDIKSEDIDRTSPILIMSNNASFEAKNVSFSTRKKRLTLYLSIDREDLRSLASNSGQILISVIGTLNDGGYFYGSDRIRINKGS